MSSLVNRWLRIFSTMLSSVFTTESEVFKSRIHDFIFSSKKAADIAGIAG